MLTNTDVAGGIMVGMGATLLMDVWALILRLTLGTAAPNYCLVGRWFSHMAKGKFFHSNISIAAPRQGECLLGWTSHYVIGVIYALALVALTSGGWLSQPTLLPGLIVGFATLAFPFLIMHPSFGLGFASARSKEPWKARLRSFLGHGIFGTGLYISALAVNGFLFN